MTSRRSCSDPRLHHQRELPAGQVAQVGLEVAAVLRARAPRRWTGVARLVDRAHDDLGEQALLVGEVLVDRLLRDAGGGGDLVHARAAVAVPQERRRWPPRGSPAACAPTAGRRRLASSAGRVRVHSDRCSTGLLSTGRYSTDGLVLDGEGRSAMTQTSPAHRAASPARRARLRSSRRAGTTAGSGSPTGAPARSSPSISTARSEVMAHGRRGAAAGRSTGCRTADCSSPARTLLRLEPDGTLVHARRPERPSPHYGWNEIVVDGRGNIYVNGIGFDFMAGERARSPASSPSSRRTATARQVADGIEFPNGMVVTPDNSTLIIAESFARPAHRVRHRGRRQPVEPAGLGRRRRPGRHLPRRRRRDLDPVRTTPDAHRPRRPPAGEAIRVREGGEILRADPARPADLRVRARRSRPPDAVHARRRLARVEEVDAVLADRTGQVLVADAPAPGAGWP